MRFSIPGNLLVTGEYAVTREGGLGFAFALEPRLSGRVEDADWLQVIGVMGPRRLSWPDDGAETGLLGAALALLAPSPDLPFRITIDSSAFFDSGGRKLGRGSSAALALALVFALDWIVGTASASESLLDAGSAYSGSLFQRALGLHRALQGGRGSGYDVAASLFGGVGVFRGGTSPSWTPVSPLWLPSVRLFLTPGPGPVSSGSAVSRFDAWGLANPLAADTYVAASNGLARRLAVAESYSSAAAAISAAATLGAALGRGIGVPATPPSDRREPWVRKAVGAGDEALLVVAPSAGSAPSWAPGTPGPSKSDLQEPPGTPIRIAGRGLLPEVAGD